MRSKSDLVTTDIPFTVVNSSNPTSDANKIIAERSSTHVRHISQLTQYRASLPLENIPQIQFGLEI